MIVRPVAVAALTAFPLLGLAVQLRPVAIVQQTQSLERALPNDNRTPAGSLVRDTLVLRLTVMLTDWYILGDSNPTFRVLAFAEEGKPPTIPGPLIRVRIGTPVRVELRNPLDDTLFVRGLNGGADARDSVMVLPGATAIMGSVANHEGTYLYWAVSAAARRLSPAAQLPIRRVHDSQLAGAFVVDPPGRVPDDRIFVITELHDRRHGPAAPESRDRHGALFRQFNAVNGRAWPHSERLQHAIGDSIRWRIVNASPESHPMHLHGFYFRVDSHGVPQQTDSIYTPAQRRMAVTETIAPRHTASIVWSPDRPGGWLFHCHLTTHVVKFPPIDMPDVLEYPTTHHDADPDQHAFTGMNGLVLGIIVTGASPLSAPARAARRLRLYVQSDSVAGDPERRFGYVVQRDVEPSRDSVQFPGPVLVLTRGEPTSIEVVNRTDEPTAVHWHGIELESYYDGVAGWSGTPGMPERTMPAVRPGQSFEVRLNPPRAGTFMYHTHFNDLRQQFGGLVGALLVLEPGERWDPGRDLVFLISDGVPQRVYINGSLTPPPLQLRVGTTYRLRLADIAVYRLALPIRLLRDSALVTWRPIAKDGFTLPPSQATVRPSIVNLPSGETADFEFTPDRPGELALEIGAPNQPLQGRVVFRVLPASPDN